MQEDKKFSRNEYLEKSVSGWTSYYALERFLFKCYNVSGNEYVQWIAECLRSDPAFMEDWALSLKEADEELKKEGLTMRTRQKIQ
jgi:hypothetical protein